MVELQRCNTLLMSKIAWRHLWMTLIKRWKQSWWKYRSVARLHSKLHDNNRDLTSDKVSISPTFKSSFFCKSVMPSLSLLTIRVCIFLATEIGKKLFLNVGDIDVDIIGVQCKHYIKVVVEFRLWISSSKSLDIKLGQYKIYFG